MFFPIFFKIFRILFLFFLPRHLLSAFRGTRFITQKHSRRSNHAGGKFNLGGADDRFGGCADVPRSFPSCVCRYLCRGAALFGGSLCLPCQATAPPPFGSQAIRLLQPTRQLAYQLIFRSRWRSAFGEVPQLSIRHVRIANHDPHLARAALRANCCRFHRGILSIRPRAAFLLNFFI